MPLVMMVNSSDRVRPARNGRMVSGASVWPMKMLAATLSGFGAARAHDLLHAHGHALDDHLHHAEVIEDGEEGGDEDDDGQHLKGEDHAEGAGLRAQRAEDELAACFGVFEQRVDGDAGGLEDLAEVGLQHQEGEGELQAQAPEEQARLISFRWSEENSNAVARIATRPSRPVNRSIGSWKPSSCLLTDDFEDQFALFRRRGRDAEGVFHQFGGFLDVALRWCSRGGRAPRRRPPSRRP